MTNEFHLEAFSTLNCWGRKEYALCLRNNQEHYGASDWQLFYKGEEDCREVIDFTDIMADRLDCFAESWTADEIKGAFFYALGVVRGKIERDQ